MPRGYYPRNQAKKQQQIAAVVDIKDFNKATDSAAALALLNEATTFIEKMTLAQYMSISEDLTMPIRLRAFLNNQR